MMLSGIEFRTCDTCARRFAVLHGVICHTCPNCWTGKKAIERRSTERQHWYTEKLNKSVRKGGRPKKYKTDSERRGAERRQGAGRQRTFRAAQRNGKPPRIFTETKDLQTQKTPLSHYPLTAHHSARKSAPSELRGGSV
jgi:predicted RNA-binding Zn-ribbon protein involved in translation (DUF1610 family)